MAVVIEHDNHENGLMNKITELYFGNATLYLNS